MEASKFDDFVTQVFAVTVDGFLCLQAEQPTDRSLLRQFLRDQGAEHDKDWHELVVLANAWLVTARELREVANLRKQKELNGAAMGKLQATVAKTKEGKELEGRREWQKTIAEELKLSESLARDQALQLSAMMEQSKPIHGATIKNFTAIDRGDEEAAFNWCLRYAPALLKVDQRLLDKFMKEFPGLVPESVGIVFTEPRTTLATKLKWGDQMEDQYEQTE